MKTKIGKYLIKDLRWLTFAAILLFVGAVFLITADKWLEGVICFAAAFCFTSLQRAYARKAEETDDGGETDES